MNEELLNKIEEFLKKELMKCATYGDNCLRSATYRIEHSYRVAYIAKEIAIKEHFDEESAFVAGLLHDIGYSIDYKTWEDFKNHGRDGAKIARPFLLSLGYSKEKVDEMCLGIAMHVDDKSGFDMEPTKLVLSIGDADNIDRFDAFRLYEALHVNDYRNLTLEKQKEFINKQICKLEKYKEMKCATDTAQQMWEEKINYQIEFYNRLKNQVDHSF